MNQTYYTILTQKGVALLDNATSQGFQLKITQMAVGDGNGNITCLLYTSPSPRDGLLSRMPSSA